MSEESNNKGNLPAKSRKKQVPYSFEVAERILLAIAEGKTLKEITEDPELPARNTVYRWLTQYPKFFDAYERAKEVSAQSLEDEALIIARNLAGPNDYTGTKVTALNYAMQQLRWSAARRDPQRYGNRDNSSPTIPIQINTTLNLGQEGLPAPQDTHQSVYTVEAVIEPRQAADTPDTEDTRSGVDEPDSGTEPPDVVYNSPAAFETPDTDTSELAPPPPPKGKPGRPKGWKPGPRKDPARAKATATRYAKKLAGKE